MEKELQEALSKVMFMTFEELGFVFPEAEMTLDQAQSEPEIAVETDFYGPFEGKVILQVCGGLVGVIASNMLASETPPAPVLQQDAMRELTNVVCGNLLPLIAGSKEVFHLKPPRILELNGLSLDGRIAEAHVGIDQGRADVYLFVDKPEDLLKHRNP